MPYIPQRRGVGDVVPVPMSSWGLVGTPCQSADGTILTAGGVNSSTALTIGGFALLGLALYAIFGGGEQ